MTIQEQSEAARQFYYDWKDKGKEDEHDQSFWIDVFQKILGVEDATSKIEFQKKVLVDGHTKRIDAYVTDTNVLIEQKSRGIALDKKIHNSGGLDLTPYEQAKRYNDNLPHSEKARYIVTSNFAEIWVYDMEKRDPVAEVQKIYIENLQTEVYRLDFLVSKESAKITKELTVSKQAGDIVGILYDELYKNYNNPTDETLKSLNKLCVRLVFCMYAEDAGLFDRKDMFYDYLIDVKPKDMRRALKELFRILDTPYDKRDPDEDEELLNFPYVNGGLFTDEEISIPQFTEELKDILLEKASNDFDWSYISPTIFGAIFESTLNPETRHKGGMHYTSIENIHKVIDPLFLDGLKAEFETIKSKKNVGGARTRSLKQFQNKLASLRFLDPAAGSGNFLTESYMSLRKLENLVLKELKSDVTEGQMTLNLSGIAEELLEIKVSIQQFYGIEINDFAVTVAKTALWIAEAQMMKETLSFADVGADFLPLKSYVNIVEGDALKIDWNDVLPSVDCSFCISNPPFLGMKEQSDTQKEELRRVSGIKNVKQMDYVAGWYFKAKDYIKDTKIECSFVSSNSISQGEQALTIWEPIFKEGININFAHRTFVWDSEASDKANVHCVIIGFSYFNRPIKYIFDNGTLEECNNINQYLKNDDTFFVSKTGKPICAVNEMTKGAQLIDNGNFVLSKQEYETAIRKEPFIKPYIRQYWNARDLLNNGEVKYALYLENCPPNIISGSSFIKERVRRVYEFRVNNNKPSTRVLADRPSHYFQSQAPEGRSLVVPVVSSQRRLYIPICFMPEGMVYTNAVFYIDNATIYDFGILESNVHMAWARKLCGRMKSDFRYSNTIVYNTFPWPTPTLEQRKKIEETAQGILDARALYPNSSLADLYDPLTMPRELQKAHTANDIAVMNAYGFNIKETSSSDCVAYLMKMYQELTSK